MANSTTRKSSAPAKLSKQEKSAARAAKRAAGKERRGQMWQAFQMQRREDKKLLPILIGTLLVVMIICTALGYFLATWWIGLVFGVLIGVLLAMIVFARRVQSNVYKQAEGQPGAAAWSLQNNLRSGGPWRVTPGIAGTAHLDAVHRVIGRPGIILVGEGATHRVKPLLAQEKKRVARIVGDTPIYDFIIGNEEGQTPLKKLNQTMIKLPRNISTTTVSELDSRLAALAGRGAQAGLPKGPMPAGAKMRNLQRTARRRSS